MISEARFLVTARSDGALKVTAFCDYGSRTVSVSEDIEDEKLSADMEKIFDKAIASARESLQIKVVASAAEAIVAANKRGEKI